MENAPSLATDETVSRKLEKSHYDYYSWPYYWDHEGTVDVANRFAGTDMDGGMGLFADQPPTEPDNLGEAVGRGETHQSVGDPGDIHLRSTGEITGYGISALDGDLGHVEDFIFDDATWIIRYIVVDTRDWWPGKWVFVPVDWIVETNWWGMNVAVNSTRDKLRHAPTWQRDKPIDGALADELSAYFGQKATAPSTSAGNQP